MTEHEKDERNKLENEVHDNGQEEDDFIMPESDGIVSGRPLEEKIEDKPVAGQYGPETLNQRILTSTGSKQARHRPETDLQQATTATTNVTIKTKLIVSLSLLTLLIILIGAVGYSSLHKLGNISILIADNYTTLARQSEEIKTGVYELHDVERDFLLLEEEETFDRAIRYTAKLQEQLTETTVLAHEIEKKTNIKISQKIMDFIDITNEHEVQFTKQAKNIRDKRKQVNSRLNDISQAKDKLLTQATANGVLAKAIIDDYWYLLLDKTSHESTTDSEDLATGLALLTIDKRLVIIELEIAKFTADEKKAHADAALTYLNAIFHDIEEIHNTNHSEKLDRGLDELVTELKKYQATFKETIEESFTAIEEAKIAQQKIEAEKQSLNQAGITLINMASELADIGWDNIASDSDTLQKISLNSKTIMLIVAICGALLGILILIFVPRPILNSINQLLINSRRVASGDLSRKINVSSGDELGILANSFEVMRLNLISLVDRIQLASAQITTTLNQIQTAANEQSSTASEQAATLNEFSSTIVEISQTADDLATITEQVSEDTSQTAEQVQSSNSNSSEILESMNTISSSTQQTSERIKTLNDQMDSINEAVSLISGIADQTTLLSLNAAIEANKAGEMGKGFSVVASEIRRLSDRSIDSASGISGIVRDIQRGTESSVVAMDKSSEEIRIGIDRVRESVESLNDINEAVERMKLQVKDISNSVQQQSTSSQQIQHTVNEMAGSSRIASQAAQQTSAATYELGAMANQLRDAVAQFKIS